MSDDGYDYDVYESDYEPVTDDEAPDDDNYYYYYTDDDTVEEEEEDDDDDDGDDDGDDDDDAPDDGTADDDTADDDTVNDTSDEDGEETTTETVDTEAFYIQPETYEDIQQTANEDAPESQSRPTDPWSAAELEQGCLTSQNPYAPAAPEVNENDGFVEYATSHMDYRKSLLEGGHQTRWGRAEFMDNLHSWATHYDRLRGKWLLFAPPAVADDLWADIRSANSRGELGGYCEVYPRNRDTDTHLISVFCNDFNDSHECIRVLYALHALCDPYNVRVAAFKPDFLSALSVYGARDGNNDAVYTHAELDIVGAWMHPPLQAALDALYGPRAPGKRGAPRTRRRRRRGRGPSPEHGPFSNPYATNVQHFPSRPNGVWTEAEQQYTWIVHYGVTAGVAALAKRDEAGFDAIATGMLDAFYNRAQREHVPSAEKAAFCRSLYELADAHDFVCGKWKVFAPPEVVDELWAAIGEANDAGELGGMAKISRFNPRSGKFLICVYCNDFRETDDCARVLHALHAICARFGVRIIANFKADFLSHLGVYTVRGNGLAVNYPLNELGLLKHWPKESLKQLLDGLKAAVRRGTW